MKKTLLFMLFFFPVSYVFGKQAVCNSTSGNLTTNVSFNSSVKSLIRQVILKNSDGSISIDKTKSYLGNSSACFQGVNFEENCSFSETTDVPSKGDYDFQFSCKSGESGELFMGAPDSVGHFQCFSSNSNSPVAQFYFGDCKVTE